MESKITNIQLRYFPLKEDYIFAQLSTQLSASEYQQLTGITPGDEQEVRSAKGRAIVLCLDKSGSMAGKAFEALKLGAQMVGKSVFAEHDFEHVVTVFYDSVVTATVCQNLAQYENAVSNSHAGGSTNFVAVFNYINNTFIKQHSTVKDISIIFFTDGCDTCSNKSQITASIDKLQQTMRKQEITSRFLTIGFTSAHDAAFLNQIAKSGSELGNFFYVDTNNPSYADQIQECLSSSLSMAQSEDGLSLRVTSNCMEYKEKVTLLKTINIDDDDDEDETTGAKKEESKKSANQTSYDFTGQMLFREQILNDISGTILIPRGEQPAILVHTLVENPTPETLARAQVKLINKLIFDAIQEVQQQTKARTNTEIYEYVIGLDNELDCYMEASFKIKDREIKKEIIQEIQDCKEKTTSVMEVLRSATGRISNAQIAQLNDLAYKAVKKRGFQKKLDERALKNEAFYKKVEKQLKEVVQKFDFKQLREQHKDLIDIVGNCPLSCNDLIEAMEAADCMCLGLDIARSEACIADPTKLIIRDIIPTFMSADSFLDSSIFSIGRNKDAHGGFDIKGEGKLAQGVGRENISGVMPLYLFKEHWELSRRKAPPIYGFLCTLDIMGYASSQYFSIPFLVLLKCIEKAEAEGKEIYKKITGLVLQTCTTLMLGNEEFRKNTINMIVNFHKDPLQRTADVVPSIPVMLCQMYTLTQLDNYTQYMPAEFGELDQAKLQKIFRFACEEQLRRSIKSGTEPLTKANILKVLFPENAEFVKKFIEQKQREIEEEMKQEKSEDSLAIYKHQAELFRSMDNQSEEVKTTGTAIEEQKSSSNSGAKQNQGIDLDDIVTQAVSSKPWLQVITNEKSDLGMMIKGAINSFDKRHKPIVLLANQMKVSDKQIEKIDQFPGIDSELEVLAALIFQNIMHPKNANRTEAIRSGQYTEINNREDATNYLAKVLQMNLKNEFASRITQIRQAINMAKASNSAAGFLEAPDIYTAAAVLTYEDLYIGKGDRTQIIYQMIKLGAACKAVKEKLILIQKIKYMGVKIFKDDFVKKQFDKMPINHVMKYRIWLVLVREKQVLTTAEFLEAFPELTGIAEEWDACLDENGKPWKDSKRFRKFLDERLRLRRQRKQQNKAQAQKKKKF